jgi:hypothetical protein
MMFWTNSLTQYSRRIRGLGLLPYFRFFVARVMTLLRLGVIRSWDVSLGGTYLDA